MADKRTTDIALPPNPKKHTEPFRKGDGAVSTWSILGRPASERGLTPQKMRDRDPRTYKELRDTTISAGRGAYEAAAKGKMDGEPRAKRPSSRRSASRRAR